MREIVESCSTNSGTDAVVELLFPVILSTPAHVLEFATELENS